ncbi:hypothetical protein ASPVEDRAFT_575917 [Aspergillus versicolor CBS 583.65]|uniref:Uncharacterized protein n=1 Tax=Aspergillus versicolor CBS 583.65 TaxID=1036611 RepID=A0A1L9PGB3_ASPVE|nr:uncharacterized protein ASPVEDRAFT_575917 [Aspergillus versicolor CBS 583.65]OJJ00564.1 hypothetical protein ASPVEDRAFT_575917 [Aspergillus versicolor CBS 583.65]
MADLKLPHVWNSWLQSALNAKTLRLSYVDGKLCREYTVSLQDHPLRPRVVPNSSYYLELITRHSLPENHTRTTTTTTTTRLALTFNEIINHAPYNALEQDLVIHKQELISFAESTWSEQGLID